MLSGSNRKDFCFKGSWKNNHSNCECSSSLLRRTQNTPVHVWFISIAMTILFSSGSVFGQFIVQPMKFEPKSKANRMVKTTLQLHSFDPEIVINIDLSVVELDQNPDGAWHIFDPDPNSIDYEEGYDVSRLSSCRSWITLEESEVELGPLAQVPVEVTIKIPPRAKGFYAAGIVASMPALNVDSDVGVLLRYLVPVLIEIQGRAYPPKIELKDVEVVNVPPKDENLATTKIKLKAENKGSTFSRLKPFARIWGFQDGHWRLITRAEFDDTGIIPGVELNLETDIMRALPSGRYRVAGALYVDGRPGRAVEKEIEFVGDPSVQKAATDAPLDLVPRDVIISGFPNSTRTEILEVINASDETVDIQTLFAEPTILLGPATGVVKGQDLTCPSWLRIEPPQFTLKSYQSKRVRIIAKIPETATKYPWHYAVLGLYAHYPDGQTAGLTTTNICVENREPLIDPEARITLENPVFRDLETENSQHWVVTYVNNAGISHFNTVKCRAGLVLTSGDMVGQVRAVASLRSDESPLILPYERRQFAGIFDLSAVPDATYRFEVNFEYDKNKSIKKQMNVQVVTRGGRKNLITTGTSEDIAPNDIIEVQW